MHPPEINAYFHPQPRLNVDYNSDPWKIAIPFEINRNWRGDTAPAELGTVVRAIWSREEILFGFECSYTELDADEHFDINEERYALWDRDVCEAFIRSPIEPGVKHYREFEIAPTGQWCDLIINRAEMLSDWEWQSGMKTESEIDASSRIWRAAMSIPFTAFDCRPAAGDVWKANLFRIGRINGERQYLTFSPTDTDAPSFHVPEKFVDLRFVK